MAASPAGRVASSPPGLVLPEAAVPADDGTVTGISGAGAVEAAAGPSLRRRTKNDAAADYMLADAAAAAAGAESVGAEPATEAAAAANDGLVHVAPSPFRLAPLELPGPSPSDSAGSMGGAAAAHGAAAGSGGTRPDVPVVFLHGVGFGVLPYLHLVRDIQQACSSTPLLMVEVSVRGRASPSMLLTWHRFCASRGATLGRAAEGTDAPPCLCGWRRQAGTAQGVALTSH